MKCVKMIVSGKVQGVSFRDNVRLKAVELGLRGYAKNLPDGKVEVMAEGEETAIIMLEGFIRNNPGKSSVKSVITKK